jgi:hypothetical protein
MEDFKDGFTLWFIGKPLSVGDQGIRFCGIVKPDSTRPKAIIEIIQLKKKVPVGNPSLEEVGRLVGVANIPQ